MNALFALALLASPSQAGVVAPVEAGVAPAGPSAPLVPVVAASGALGAVPSLGANPDLRGGLPVLPAPVPGLAAPAPTVHFVGHIPAARSLRPEAVAARTAQAEPADAEVRLEPAGKTPALPAASAPGRSSVAMSRDRASAAATSPLVDPARLDRAQPETAARLGRNFFDQSAEKGRGMLAARASSDSPTRASAGASIDRETAQAGRDDAGRFSRTDADVALVRGAAQDRGGPSGAAQEETLRDAVASGPQAAAFVRSAAPNGSLEALSGASGAAVLPGAPRPLALDLSRSGLIVRVRAALNGVLVSERVAAAAPPSAMPAPSTALLERGALLEAFSVARAYAGGAAAGSVVEPLTTGVSRAVTPLASSVPVPPASRAPLWWAWLILPLFVVALRGIF